MKAPPDRLMEIFRFLREAGALQFGEYTLKSGRVSPYFFNSGRFDTGGLLERLGGYYGAAIAAHAPEAGIVFGPAYKGVPLCVAAATALGRLTGREVGYLFDRKEAKGHGDRGDFVGRKPRPGERLVMVDDVITAGETKLDAVRKLREAFQAPIDALVIAFNRMEVDVGGEDAVRRFTEATGIPVVSLFSLADLERAIEENLRNEAVMERVSPTVSREIGPLPDAEMLEKIRAYHRRYGTA